MFSVLYTSTVSLGVECCDKLLDIGGIGPERDWPIISSGVILTPLDFSIRRKASKRECAKSKNREPNEIRVRLCI